MNALETRKTLLAIVIFSILGCSKIYHKSELFLARSDFDFKQITFKTNGYYYLEKVNDSLKTCAIVPIIFYNDGYVRKSEFIQGIKSYTTEESKRDSIKKSLSDLESSFVDNSFHGQSKNNIRDWGMYKQTKDEVLIQYYSKHFGDYRLINVFGKIENDSTIILKRKFGYEQPNYPYKINEELNEVYKFKEFHTKPDSTNYIRTNIHKFG